MTNFKINNNNRKGLLFVSYTGADLFLIWNNKTNTALISNAKANPCGVDTVQLPVSTLKGLKSQLKQLSNRGYTIYSTSGGLQDKKFIELNDIKSMDKVIATLAK